MEIKAIEYEACFKLDNYENEKLRIKASISPDTDLTAAFEELRQKAIECAQPNPQKVWHERRKLEGELLELRQQVKKIRQDWETVSSFMVAQGIKQMTDFPILENLLPASAPVEEVEVELEDEIPFSDAEF